MTKTAMEKLIEEVMNCATEVYHVLGAGYEERIYEEAMAAEFRKRKIPYEIERDVEVFYKGEKVGVHKLDFIVMDIKMKHALVVELKSATVIAKSHIAQTASYLKTLNITQGLLINFPYPQMDKPQMKVVEIKKREG